jgi:hypothetical protein
MMWFISACSALFISIFCLVNRSHVEIDIWPFPLKQQVQLFVLLLASLGIGILWGGCATWLSAGTYRKKSRQSKRLAIAAELDAKYLKERCRNLEQELHDLRVQEKSTTSHIEKPSPLEISSNINKV